MITQGIVSVALSVAGWVASLFPSAPGLSDSITQMNGFLADLMASFVGLGAWVDWVFLGACVALVVSVYLVMFGAKLFRAVASYIPFFGGAG